MTYHLAESLPDPSDYAYLRTAVGWNELSLDAIEQGLHGSLYSVCIYLGDKLVGCGRVVGDGSIYFYLQDVIVLPEHQGQGLGKRIMEKLIDYLHHHAYPNSFIGLMAAKGAEHFYRHYGFEKRPDDRPGMYRIWQNE